MKAATSLSIAYIAGSLISGKPIASLYDYSQARYIDIACLPHAQYLKQFDYARGVSNFGATSGSRYRYSFDSGNFIDLTINGRTFIGYLSEGSCHFIGNVRGDSIYIYDYDEAAYFNYRISGCAVGPENGYSVRIPEGLAETVLFSDQSR
jgi:hypothetical protein